MKYDKKWQRIRQAPLRRDEFLCQECKRYGKTESALDVHHILPADECIGDLAYLRYDSRNLISLCGKCHKAMHIAHSKELSEKGKKLLLRSRVVKDGLI